MDECTTTDPRCEQLFKDIKDDLKESREERKDFREALAAILAANGWAGKVVRLEERAATSGRRWGLIAGIGAAIVANLCTYAISYYFVARALARLAPSP